MENKYSLTFPQKNIWSVEKFFGKSPINTIVGIFKVNKEFDKDICEKAVNKMVELNDALRIKIVKKANEEVEQYVDKYSYFNVDFFDMSDKNKEELEELEEKLTVLPFDVINNNLYYFAIVKVTKTSGYIFVKLHHLVSDAWTFGNVATELSEYIDAFTNNTEIVDAKPSYVDFIQSEKEYVNSEKFKKDAEFWQEYLLGVKEEVGIKEKSGSIDTNAKRYTTKMDTKLNEMVKAYCRENRVSPYTLFMNALAIYVHRVTEKVDFVIGTPVLNRSNFKEKKMMGMFVSTMPVRFKIDEEETFLEMCKKSASETMSLFRHQKYPYSMILKEYREKNNVSSNLYSVMVSYQNARAEYSDGEKYTTDWRFSTQAQDELAIHIMDMDETGVLQVHFDYLTSLYSDVEVEYISKRIFEIIYDGISRDAKIKDIEIMPKEEKNIILSKFNDTCVDYPRNASIIELFEKEVKKHRDKVAVVFEKRRITYGKLDEEADKIASFLQRRNVKPGDRIGIMQGKGIDIIISILAVLKVNAIYVPIDYNSTLMNKRHIIQNSELKFILSDVRRAKIDNIEIINFYDIPKNESGYIKCNSNPEDVVNIMYTSGTTGKPKGVAITNRNIIKLVKNSNYINFENDSIMMQTGSYTFDASTLEIWNGLLNGIPLHVIKNEHLNPEMFEKYIKENNISVIFLTSAIFNQMVGYNAKMFESVRLLMTGGEAMSKEHALKLINNCPNTTLENLYGPTENTVVSTYYVVNKNDKEIPIGRPIANTTCYVLDSKRRLLPINVEGTLYVGGDGVAKEYINNLKLTEEKFVNIQYEKEKVYNTGDIVKYNYDGNISFLGRKDDEIKIKGIRINIDEIKSVVNSYSKIVNNEILCLNDSFGNKYLAVAFTSGLTEDISKLKRYLRNFLPVQIIPRKILQIDKIPLTLNGKIDKKKLVEIFEQIKEENRDISHYTGIYLKLYNLYKEVLGTGEIDLDDDFFEIGGDSLLGVNLITKAIEKDIKLTYSDLYKYRTIRKLGNMLEEGTNTKSISQNISDYDYTSIEKMLSSQRTKKDDEHFTECKDIILTGATGYLGVHILKEFIEKHDGKVCCVLRKVGTDTAKKRLLDRIAYYFENIDINKIEHRIEVVEYSGELTCEVLEKIDTSNITHFINSLALVKHYGDDEEFFYVNVNIVDKISDFCVNRGLEFIHISTLSVSGDIVETAKEIKEKEIIKKEYSEDNFFVGQTLDNIYAYTKFLAERIVFEKILSKGLKARVFRMGNLLDRYSDGKFQINAKDNAFSERLKSLILLGIIPEDTKNRSYDFTPVDFAAKAILTLIGCNENQIVYHLYNNKKVEIAKVVQMINDMGISLRFGKSEEISERIHQIILENKQEEINGIIVDITKEIDLKYVTDIDVVNKITTAILARNSFKWPDVSDKYLRDVINRIIKL